MGIIEFSLKRRVTVSMAATALIIFGWVAFNRLPLNLLPDISYPSLTVETRFPGAAPSEVETLVSRPVEEAVGVVTGVQRITSVSRPGLSQVTLEFQWDRNMDFASIDVREKLDLVILPRQSEKPVLLRFDPSNDPIVRLYVTGGTSLYQLRYVAEEVLKKDLESTEGVAAIKVNGGYEEEIEVRVDEGKLSLLGLSVQDVNEKLANENINQAGGSLYEEEARYLVRSRNEFEDLTDIMDTVLTTVQGRNVVLGDVAEVVRGHKLRDVVSRYKGDEAVELAMYKEGDANTVKVAQNIYNRLDGVKKELPEGIEVAVGVDQSRFIKGSIDEVISNAILGGAIAMVVLLFFLRNLVSTIIIGVSIPISVIATFFLMYQTGTSLNVMSLGGLALGVGMLVDNAIVVLESIHKRHERGETGLQAALGGASEVGRAVVASTLTTVAVFVPVVFVEGVAAQLFRDQALTVSFSLMASLAVSLTLIPMMGAMTTGFGAPGAGHSVAAPPAPLPPLSGRRLVRWMQLTSRFCIRHMRTFFRFALVTVPGVLLLVIRRTVKYTVGLLSVVFWPLAKLFDTALGGVSRAYPAMLGWSLNARPLVILIAVGAFVGSLAIGRTLGVDLIPQFSQGEFSFLVEMPEGTPLESTDRVLRDAQVALKEDARVEAFSSIVGGAGLSLTNTGTEGENVGRIQVRMMPGTTGEDEEAVAAVLRARLEVFDSAKYKFERPSYFTFRTPIEVEIVGDSLEELKLAADRLRVRVAGIPGIVDVKSSAEMGNPELQISFNREQLARLDLDLSRVASTVRNKVQGEVATRFLEGDREIDIMVRSMEMGRASVRDVDDLIIGQAGNVPIFLKSVAEVNLAEGPSEIRRIDQKRAAVISGNLDGRDMASVAADVRGAIREEVLPAGVVADLSGQEEELQTSFNSLMMAMGLAIFLVYLVMASQFESLLHPFVVMFSVPLGAVGAIVALAITGNSLNVVAMIGAVMLAGIVVNNAIILVDTINQHREKGQGKREALIEAGKDRLRPILMTSSTTILGLLPMAVGLGSGAELRAPLAITVIGGLTAATALTLIVIPVVYSILDRKVFAVTGAEETSAVGGRGDEMPVPGTHGVEPAK